MVKKKKSIFKFIVAMFLLMVLMIHKIVKALIPVYILSMWLILTNNEGRMMGIVLIMVLIGGFMYEFNREDVFKITNEIADRRF